MVLVSGFYEGCKDPMHKFQLLRLRIYPAISQINTGFLPPSGLYQPIEHVYNSFHGYQSQGFDVEPRWASGVVVGPRM
jgi:hypothetical protein